MMDSSHREHLAAWLALRLNERLGKSSSSPEPVSDESIAAFLDGNVSDSERQKIMRYLLADREAYQFWIQLVETTYGDLPEEEAAMVAAPAAQPSWLDKLRSWWLEGSHASMGWGGAIAASALAIFVMTDSGAPAWQQGYISYQAQPAFEGRVAALDYAMRGRGGERLTTVPAWRQQILAGAYQTLNETESGRALLDGYLRSLSLGEFAGTDVTNESLAELGAWAAVTIPFCAEPVDATEVQNLSQQLPRESFPELPGDWRPESQPDSWSEAELCGLADRLLRN